MQKHASARQGGPQAVQNVRNKNASPVANDYLGMKQLRNVNRSGTAASATPSMMTADRYEKRQSARQSHQMATGLEDLDDA